MNPIPSNLPATRRHMARMRRAFRDNAMRRISDPPEAKKCGMCNQPMVIDGAYWICVNPDCDHTELRFKLKREYQPKVPLT